MVPDPFIQHINVNVEDLPTAVAFYCEVLGLALDATPDQGFESQFFRLRSGQQIHMNAIPDLHPFRAHFCLEVSDFNGVFRRAKAAGAIDVEPWGRVRKLPSGKMQMFVRDPHGNLIEIASDPLSRIDQEIFEDELVEPLPGVYRIPKGAAEGGHENR